MSLRIRPLFSSFTRTVLGNLYNSVTHWHYDLSLSSSFLYCNRRWANCIMEVESITNCVTSEPSTLSRMLTRRQSNKFFIGLHQPVLNFFCVLVGSVPVVTRTM